MHTPDNGKPAKGTKLLFPCGRIQRRKQHCLYAFCFKNKETDNRTEDCWCTGKSGSIWGNWRFRLSVAERGSDLFWRKHRDFKRAGNIRYRKTAFCIQRLLGEYWDFSCCSRVWEISCFCRSSGQIMGWSQYTGAGNSSIRKTGRTHQYIFLYAFGRRRVSVLCGWDWTVCNWGLWQRDTENAFVSV